MTDHRFFVDPDQIRGDVVTISGPQARQIRTVLRLRAGDSISVLDGSGACHAARIGAVTRNEVIAGITGSVEMETEPSVRLTLAQALPKGDKIDLVVQKATELGASEIVVYTSERTVPEPAAEKIAHRLARWGSIAREAAEQSFRATIPAVTGIIDFPEMLRRAASYDHVLVAWEEERAHPLRNSLAGLSSGSQVAFIVGPEGGFSESEIRAAREAGATPVSLGRRMLRSETAAIAGCAIILHCAAPANPLSLEGEG